MFGFRLRAFHPLWSAFPHASPNLPTATTGSFNPRVQAPGFGLFRFRSPLLTESLSFSSPLVTEMFHFTRCRARRAMYSRGGDRALPRPGYPIRKSTGRSVFAAFRGLSQLITSFIACWHQGIHHALLVAFFILILLKFLLGGPLGLSAAEPAQTQLCQLFGSCNFSSLICECQRTVPAALPEDLIRIELSIVRYRKNSKRANVCGGRGPDRTRTYDPALIKRML